MELTAFLAGIAGTYFFGIAEVSRNLHKFLIGKNGNNIAKIKAIEDWQDRLVDIVVPSENGDSEDIIVVVKKPNNPSPSTDKECSTLIEKGRAHIIAFASGLADFVTKIVSVDAKYHGRLIGSGGEKLKEILGSHINAVSVKFPHGHEKDKGGTDALENGHTNGNASDPSAIVIKGPSKDVMEVSDKISKAVAEYRHTEVMNSFEQTVKVAKGVGKRLLNGAGLGGSGIGWLLKAVKEGLAAKADRHHPNFPAADSNGHLGLKVDLDESGTTNDIIKLTGPKLTAEIAKKLLEERGVELADLVDIEVKPFENLSLDAMKSLSETDEETKLKILRRVIGKDKRNVKKLSAKFNVFVKFVDQKDVDGEKEADFVQGSFSIRGSSKESELARLELVQAIENEVSWV